MPLHGPWSFRCDRSGIVQKYCIMLQCCYSSISTGSVKCEQNIGKAYIHVGGHIFV